MFLTLADLVESIRPPERASAAAVRCHLDSLTKPPGSLGELENIALRLAVIYGDPTPPLVARVVFLLAADHGVTAQGVSAYPSQVTAEMCRNYARGGAAVSAIARSVGARVITADLGVDADLSGVTGLIHAKVRRGTRDLSLESAMTADEVTAAILAGARLVEESDPVDVIGLGEMGIGNTTSASAVTAALTGAPVERVVGSGTGVDADGRARKARAVRAGLDRLHGTSDPFAVLQEVGGLEIAGLVGVALAGASLGRAVLTDGFIATAALLVAARLAPNARPYFFASHCSAKPGHAVLLEELGLEPIFRLGLRLGEGTGAALAFPVLDAAAAILREMATFESAGVSGPSASAG